MRRVWADVILSAERQHLLRLLAWSGLSIVLGTSVAVIIAARRLRSPLLTHFAMQTIGWGVTLGALSMLSWRGLHLRDVGGAALLERILWMRIGLEIGCLAVGATLALAGRSTERRLAFFGAGVGVMVQGAALLLLDLQFAGLVSR
ncbi:MAG TPA: hypothetical protein VGM82_06450 [Gemmatimonadaceae bacterium]|jgi:hypothetical protein